MNRTTKTPASIHGISASTSTRPVPSRVLARSGRSGLTVAILGPDGAGKSTLIEAIDAAQVLPTAVVYMGGNAATANHSLPTTRWLVRHGAIDTWAPAAVTSVLNRQNSVIARTWRSVREAVKFANEVFEFAYRFAIAFSAKSSGKVVLFDRYIYDPLIDALVNGASRGQWLRARLFQRVFPKPDLVVILGAPGSLLFERKGEHSPQSLDRMLSACRWVVRDFPSVEYLDATQPSTEVLRRAISCIQRHIKK